MDNETGFFVDDDAIKYRELRRGGHWDKTIITKEIFIEAYNKWIGNAQYSFAGQDSADDWSED